MEQEANILRSKTQTLEQENDKLLAEIKKLQLQGARNSSKIVGANNKENESENFKSLHKEMQQECENLRSKLKQLESGPYKLPERTPKVYNDTKTKLQLKVLIKYYDEIYLYILYIPLPHRVLIYYLFGFENES